MTFAIYGHWGMGKSSALRLLRERARDIAREHGVLERLKLCEYVASAYEPLPVSASVSLAQRMFTALVNDIGEAINMWAADQISSGEITFSEKIDPRFLAGRSSILQNMATTLPKLIDFDKILQEKIQGTNGDCVLLVLIDDLDRCTSDFIWQILNFIQQLSDVPNLFFILAVEPDYLKNAIERVLKPIYDGSSKEVSADFALEKYIQYHINVPNMKEDRLHSFIEKLMNNYEEGSYLAQEVTKNIELLNLVIQATKGEHILTPRFVIRFLNILRSELATNLKRASSESNRQLIIKEVLLNLTWPRFYEECFKPTQEGPHVKISKNRFGLLELYCFRVINFDNTEEDRENLRQVGSTYNHYLFNSDDHSIKRELVTYLGTEPHWYSQESNLAKNAGLNRNLPNETLEENIIKLNPIET